MIRRITLLLLLAGLMGISCKNNSRESGTVENAAPVVAKRVFGDTINTDGSISVTEVINALKTTEKLDCAVSGDATSVCQVKGCWMLLSAQPGDTTGLFVKFKDYAFFVPKDLTGSKVTVRGTAFKEITSVEDLKHYAEDEGKSKEEIDAIRDPQEELKFIANGVIAENK